LIVYLSVEQLLLLHQTQIGRFGGGRGLRDLGALESAAARPAMTFDGEDLYPDLAAKAAALMYLLVMNHPFVDGNKRVGAAASELFVLVNDSQLEATDEEFEKIALAVARGEVEADALAIWFRQRISRRD
jgi:death-on-curing protein